jgi:ATP phosphoribosyltransferase
MSKSARRFRLAIQSSGRLRDDSLTYLRSLGAQLSESAERRLIQSCHNFSLDIISVRHSDIPRYVASGAADYGICGANVLTELSMPANIIETMAFGFCKLVIAIPEQSIIQSVADLEGERIATAYPMSLEQWLQDQDIHAAIIPIRGSVEASVELNLADAICDLTQTGRTLQAHRLVPLTTVLESQAVLIQSPHAAKPFFELFKTQPMYETVSV